MYIAHTSDLFFSPVVSGYAMFALSSRDKTNRSTDTSILCCYNGTIKRKKLDIKKHLLRALCSCVLVLLFLLWWWWLFFFSCHSGVGFCFFCLFVFLATVTMLPHLISFLFFLTRLAKQNKTNRRRLFISHHKWLCLPCTVSRAT